MLITDVAIVRDSCLLLSLMPTESTFVMSMLIGVIGPGLTKSSAVNVSPVGTPTFVDS